MASIYANGSRNHHKFTLAVSEVGTSKEENTSQVSFQFTISPVVQSFDWRYWGNSISYTVTVNGTDFAGTIPDYDGYSTVILKSGSLNVPHNPDGTKTLTFGFSVTDKAGMSYTCGNAGASGSMALTRILRTPPTLSASVEDCNPDTLALTGDKETLVRYFSHGAFFLEAAAHDGATITERSASCGGKTLSGFNGVFENTESGSFTFTATDSYGNSASETLTLPMIPYIPLTCNLASTRPDAEGNMALSVSGNCFNGSFGAKENTLAVYFRYRESGGTFGDWIEMTGRRSGNSYTAETKLTGLDYQKAYVFQAKAEDCLDSQETSEYTAKAIPVFDWGEGDFNINGTLKLQGTSLADYIVEQGADGIWHYRKWNSGVAECWGEEDMTISFAGASPAYYSTNKLYPRLPSGLFTDSPVATATVHNTASAYVVACIHSASAGSLGICFGRFYGGTDDVAATVKMYAIGKWK
ncbi:MAG: hypothetical protein IJW41_01860 [Oscillospiraceae bacterium]|nr:hypothetical protein [Oscillospiraceae bacterium]